jgi:hypothetical protein
LNRPAFAALTALGLLALPSSAEAHGLVSKADLPIPPWLFICAAVVVLVVSFVALAKLWAEPRLKRDRGRPLFRVPSWVDPVCGIVGVAILVAVVYAGLAGTRNPNQNLAPNVVYVYYWVGVVLVSVFLGDVFRAFNPWRALGRTGGWLAARAGRSPPRREYPTWLGHWPAAVTILAFAWIELVYSEKADPHVVAYLCLAYVAIQLTAMAFFGVERWTERGDGFSVYFNLFARLSPLARRGDVLMLRRPLSGAARLPVVAGTAGLLCVAIGTTSFDGFSGGPVWESLRPDLQSAFGDSGLSVAHAGELADTVGLVSCVAVASLLYWLGVRGMKTVGEGHSVGELARLFAHSLVPIAFAYAIAHYFSLLAFRGQAMAALISDPLGDGSDLFGTADATIDRDLISIAGIWYVQVAALIAGHVSGLVLAHDRALTVYRRAREATRSQYWMLVVMVGFTTLALWLLLKRE